jgi:hypothetical protein
MGSQESGEAKHWRFAPAPGAQPLLTAWYTQRITGLWNEKRARDALRTPSAKSSVPAASFSWQSRLHRAARQVPGTPA